MSEKLEIDVINDLTPNARKIIQQIWKQGEKDRLIIGNILEFVQKEKERVGAITSIIKTSKYSFENRDELLANRKYGDLLLRFEKIINDMIFDKEQENE